jgi:hypothetical protein
VPLLAIVVAGALAILAGVWAAHIAAPSKPEPPPVRIVEVGPARVAVPAHWQRAPRHSAGIAGLNAERAVALDPTPGGSTRVLAVFAPTVEPSLIPRDLRSAFRGRLPAPSATRVAGWPAWVYRDMTSRPSGRRADVTVFATTAGVLAIACTAMATSAAVSGCASQVASVQVPGATTLLPSRSLALELALPAVLDRLNRARRRHRTALRGAHTGASQALAALRLGGDHRAAARSLLVAGGPAAAPLIRDLTDAADAYEALRRAAEAAAPPEFAAARAAVRRTDEELAREVVRVPRPASATHAASPAARPQGREDRASGGVPRLVFALLILLAAAAGAATGYSDAARRLWRSAVTAAGPATATEPPWYTHDGMAARITSSSTRRTQSSRPAGRS